MNKIKCLMAMAMAESKTKKVTLTDEQIEQASNDMEAAIKSVLEGYGLPIEYDRGLICTFFLDKDGDEQNSSWNPSIVQE